MCIIEINVECFVEYTFENAMYKEGLQNHGGKSCDFLARLFSKKMSRYCHSPGVVGSGVVRKLRHFLILC